MPRDRWGMAQRLSAVAVQIGDLTLPKMNVTVRPKLRAGADVTQQMDWSRSPDDIVAWSFSLLAAKGLRRELNGTVRTVRIWANLASVADGEMLLIEFPAASVRGTCCRIVGEIAGSGSWTVTSEAPPS